MSKCCQDEKTNGRSQSSTPEKHESHCGCSNNRHDFNHEEIHSNFGKNDEMNTVVDNQQTGCCQSGNEQK